MDELQYQIDLLSAMNQKLSSNLEMYQKICEMSKNTYVYCDFVRNKIDVMGQFQQYFPFQLSSIADLEHVLEYVKEEYVEDLRNVICLEYKNVEKDEVECCLIKGGVWLHIETVVVRDGQGRPQSKIVRIMDISQTKRQKEELKYLAYYDMMTGMYNRNYFISLLSKWMEKAKDEKDVIGLICIDIDDFKKISDGMGIVIGDELLQVFGQYLKEFECDDIMVARANNDVFYMAVYAPFGSKSVEKLCEKINKRLEEPFKLTQNREIFVTVCMGIAMYPESTHNAVELLNCAEIITLQAKMAGKNTIRYFETPVLEEFKEMIEIENQLKAAILNNQFELYFQPQFEAEDKKLRGVEALIRWWDEKGHMVSPAVFIPIAEESGMIVSIGDWVIEEAVRIYAQWKEKFDCDFVLSINISAIQYRKPDFVPNLIKVLNKYHVDAKAIELEITESVLIKDFVEVVRQLRVLKDYGIKISLDDFGTGFSSLSYLKGLPIDTLKIDKSFVDSVLEDQSTQVITEAIVSMVKKLGYETVAEGVETEEQYQYLRNIECDNIQGYLLGKPMPAKDIEQVITQNMDKE